MSFEDIKQRIETGFISPLQDFRARTAPLNTIHNESLNKLSNTISALIHGPNAFQGDAANALTELVNNFISRERQLSGDDSDPQGWDLTGRLGDASDKNQKYAAFFETVLDAIQNAQPASTKGLDELSSGGLSIAGGLDTGAGVQLGLDIPWDILAAAASGIALGLAASDALAHFINNPDQQRASAATAVLEQTIPQIEQDYQIIESSDPLPPRMDPPQGPSGDYKSFLLLLGLAIGAGGTVMYLDSSTPVNLTPAQKRLLQDVKSRLGNTPYDEREIEALIAAGYLDPDAIAAMIRGGTYTAFNDAGIAKKMNPLTGAQQLYIIDLITNKKYAGDPKDAVIAILNTNTLQQSEGMTTLADNKTHTYVGHTLSSHVAIDRPILIERTSKSNNKGGRSDVTSFSNPEVAQNGVNMVIARSTKLQAFIKAAIPNTNEQDTQCGSTSDNFGYGYVRNPILKDGRVTGYGPSIPYNSIHCVTVVMGINEDGQPFIMDAYPAIPKSN
jgi:hypothetical protein